MACASQLAQVRPASFDFSVTFVTHADVREFVIFMVAAAVLCQVAGGVLVDPQSGESWSGEEALSWARSEVPGLEEYF